jgi:sulfur-oxidizing protein SoxA
MRRLALPLLFVFVASLAVAQTDKRRSGYADMGASLRQMQDDDTSNPAMLWVQEGETLWSKKTGAANFACADCHQDMKGVAARYPAWSGPQGKPIDLEQRIQMCRTWHQKGAPLADESRELLALTAFVAKQSRGLPMSPPDDRRLDEALKQGEGFYKLRQGQLNLSCAQCHDDNAGQKLAAVTIPQGHPNAYPLYRLEWQTVGSLKRRLRNCLIGVRAEPFAYDAPEYVALELYLAKRAAGMTVEAPGVRP